MKIIKILTSLILSVVMVSNAWGTYPPTAPYTVSAGNTILADHYNATNSAWINSNIPEDIDDYSVNATELMATKDLYPGQSEALPASLSEELQGLRNSFLQWQLKFQAGRTKWYNDIPPGGDLWTTGADVASAAALPLLDDGIRNDVTGTDAITSMDTVGVGTIKLLQFDGVLVLTHHSTNLILLDGVNITTSAGDRAWFHEYASGDWELISWSGHKLITFPGLYARERDDKWALKGLVTAADRYTLETPIKLQIEVNSELHDITSVAEYDLSASATWDTTGGTDYTVAANRAGLPFYIYAINNSGTTLIEISANSTVPDGYTAATSRKIGGFDCLCVDVGTISGHGLTTFLAGDILPASIWDYDNRPVSSPEGMVLALTGRWIDIYLPSVSSGELVSEYNATIADGASTEKFHTYKFEQWFARIGKKTISQLEFVDASIGSNQGTSITGSADPSTTGGHSDTAGRRMISDIGCEDMCGAMWQWGRDAGSVTGSATWRDAFDGEDSDVAGQHYEESYRPLLGGPWAYGAKCGSRGSEWNNSPLVLVSNSSSRGVAEPKN